MAAAAKKAQRLKKELGLFDVYAICTGAMFSSGFFLLPGLAAAQTGPSVGLAYLIAGLMMLPAMFSMAELSTAMPRAGGDYYFLERSLGPLVGTIGGIGTYLALTLKTAFALVGIGAYLALFVDVPIRPVAVGLTFVFMILNVVGAKETTGLQRILIVVLLSVMTLFIIQGFVSVFSVGVGDVVERQFTPFMPFGFSGLIGTVGFVFVSYAGLTKIASVSEEVINPNRNIPLGMMLSIISTTIIYVVGIFIMVALLDANELRADLTPVATAAEGMFDWMPGSLGVILVVIAAVAAFASTGNAGILAASRYPLAMGRDGLIPSIFSAIGRFRTPFVSIATTSGLIIFSILALDESGIAKLASGFQLLIFALVNLSVIVMRESHIEFYDPAYKSPFYPWMQIAGIMVSVFLIAYLGLLAVGLTVGVAILSGVWYFYFASENVNRHGAIFHWFARLGVKRYTGLERELRDILKEKGLREDDPFEEVVTRASVIDLKNPQSIEDITTKAITLLSQPLPFIDEKYKQAFMDSVNNSNYVFASHNAAMPNLRFDKASQTELVIVRSCEGIPIESENGTPTKLHALFYLVGSTDNPGQHLRMLTEIVKQIENPSFKRDWLQAADGQELKEILLHDERLLTLWVRQKTRTAPLIGKMLRELDLPADSLVAVIRREDRTIVPRGGTTLREGDRITIIGDLADIQELYEEYVGDHPEEQPEVTNPNMIEEV